MEIITKQDYENFVKFLKEKSAVEDFVLFSQKIIKTNKPMIGVRTPELRKLAKEIYKQNHSGLFHYDFGNFEESLIKGLVLAQYKEFDKVEKPLTKLINSFDSWGEVDMVCSNLAFVKNDKEKARQYFYSLVKSEKEFVCRFGVVALMKYFLDENEIENTFKQLDTIICDKYYVEMAIAWLISEVLIKNPQKAPENMQKIIKNHHFNKFIINKGIQKGCESYRIDDQTKQKLREMKI